MEFTSCLLYKKDPFYILQMITEVFKVKNQMKAWMSLVRYKEFARIPQKMPVINLYKSTVIKIKH